jgi:hypothetical protein
VALKRAEVREKVLMLARKETKRTREIKEIYRYES